ARSCAGACRPSRRWLLSQQRLSTPFSGGGRRPQLSPAAASRGPSSASGARSWPRTPGRRRLEPPRPPPGPRLPPPAA
ncbi:unnamed protein product, partial [Prorocentrum cordatum]